MDLDKIKSIVNSALKAGAEEAEVFYLINDVFTARIANSKILEPKGVVDEGIAVRVIANGGLGFSATNDLSEEGIMMAVKRALKVARRRPLPFKYSLPKPQPYSPVEGIYDKELAQISREKAVELAYRALNAAIQYDKRVVDVSGTLNIVKYNIKIANSNGVEAEDRGTFLEGVIATTAREAGVESEGYESTACRILKDYEPEKIGQESAKMAVDGLKAEKINEGTYCIVLAPRAAADLALRVGYFSHPIIAKSTYQFFLGKEGQKVASEKLSILDDPRMPRGPYSCSIDDEGVPSQTKYLIKNGVFKGFYYDSYAAAMNGKTSTGNGFRPYGPAGFTRLPGKNFLTEPSAAPSTLIIKGGDFKADEIISDVKDGLLIKHMHYVRVTNPVRGDYTAVLRMGLYKIRNGEIVSAVKKSRLVDNIMSILNNVDAVANDVKVAGQWGRYAVAPTLRISKVRIVPV